MASDYDIEYDAGAVVIDQACACWIDWQYNDPYGMYVYLNPILYRCDYSWDETDSSGSMDVTLKPKSSADYSKAKTWTGLSATRYAGDGAVKKLATLSAAGWYERKAYDYTVTLTVNFHNWYSHGQWSGDGTCKFQITIPAAPTPKAPVAADGVQFATYDKNANKIVLNWATQEDINTYAKQWYGGLVERRVDNGEFTQIGIASFHGTTYTDTNIEAGHAYAYRVRYYNNRYSNYYPSLSSVSNVQTTLLIPTIDKITLSNNGTIANVHWVNNNASANFDSQVVSYSKNGGLFSSTGNIESKQTRNLSVDISSDTNALYRFKVTVKQSASGTQEAVSVSSAEYILWTVPVTPTAVSHSRTDDTTNEVTWVYSGSENNITNFNVLRSVDGGAFSLIAAVAPSSRAYTDKTCKADSSYSYKIRAVNPQYTNSETNEVTSDVTYNTPTAPYIVSGYRVSTDSTVHLTLRNNSKVSSKVYVYLRAEGSTTTILAHQELGKPTQVEIDASAYQSTLYFSVCNVVTSGGEELLSDRSETYAIELNQLPDYPVAVLPVNGSKATWYEDDELGKCLYFEWEYDELNNPPQASAKVGITYADVLYYNDSPFVTWRNIGGKTIASSEHHCSIPIGGLELESGETYHWDVVITTAAGTTTGNAEYEYQRASFVYCDTPDPTVEVTNTDGNSVLLSFPVCVSVTDVSNMAYYDLRITRPAEDDSTREVTVFQKSGYQETIAQIGLDEFIPDMDITYTVYATAYNEDGFFNTSKASAIFKTSSAGVADMIVNVENNTDNGSATLSITPNAASGNSPTRLILIRESDHTAFLLDINDDAIAFVDKYAPINLTYNYRLLALTANGGVYIKTIPNIIRSPYWFFLWDDKMARGIWDCSDPWSITRPDKTLKYYAGRKDPVSYDTSSLSITHKAHFWVETRQEAIDFYNLMLDGGRCVFKSGEGFVFRADVEIDVTPTYRIDSWYGEVECDITRISGSDNL